MKAHFSAPTPRFGRKNSRLPIGHQERSPYYWWWQYLRRNEDYLACCEKKGKGPLSKLYADFGDVRGDDFHVWWTEGHRGVRLFAEQPLAVKFGELSTRDEWQAHWTADSVMVVAVPLAVSKRRLKGAFSALLEQRHSGHKSGRPSLAAMKGTSTALFKLERNYTISHLQTALAVYDLWLENQRRDASEHLALWQIGSKLNINRQAAKDAISDHKADRAVGRNVLGATVSRYVRQARTIIANTATGRFPVI
jgi:hypothetical protein